jgi:hypothetical protein
VSVLAIVVILITAIAAGYGMLTALRRSRTPDELRGDWWTEFEREFRAYARTSARFQPRRRRQRPPSGT